MNFSLSLAACAGALCAMMASSFAAPAGDTSDILATLKLTHPRLIASDESWNQIKIQRSEDAELDAFLQRGDVEAKAFLELPPLVYKKEGIRLLHISRAALRRVLLLSLQFKITGNRKFLERAQSEMLALAAFPDWNPNHFLDVGEMTAALALGYDWLHDDLDAAARQNIAAAIADKGLRAGLQHSGWMKVDNNWNSVCHAGLTLGALAIAESEPALAAQTLQNAREFNPLGLTAYAPDGIYPEGASYWGYGTSFQVMLIAALESALGTDWNLSQSPGFLASAGVLQQTKGPTDTHFNFFDSSERVEVDSTFFWFAQKMKQPALLADQRVYVAKYSAQSGEPKANSQGPRLLPLAALWWPSNGLDRVPAKTSASRFWHGRGENPLAAFRERWNDPNAMFLALKGGRAALNHGHMDAGTFVFDADGVRWARDLGMQDYHSLESRGIRLWDRKQNSQRWSVFRLNNFSHNTLTINDQLHNVNGQAEITHFSDDENHAGAIVDLTPVFAGQATRVMRGFAFRPSAHILIRDEIEGLKAGATTRFAMLTKADINIEAGGQGATLTQEGKKLRVSLEDIEGIKWEVITANPPNDYDAPNPGLHFLIARFTAPASGKIAYSVKLQPETARAVNDLLARTELHQWPLSAVK